MANPFQTFVWCVVTGLLPLAAVARPPQAGEPYVVTDLALTLQPIPAGAFVMGSAYRQVGRRWEESHEHPANIAVGFWLGSSPVTQRQWQLLMGTDPQERVKKLGDPLQETQSGPTLPVNFVSWHDAVAFCQKLTEREHRAGRLDEAWQFSLPTESEWEYACRAGTSSAAYADDLESIAWFRANAKKRSLLGIAYGFEAQPVARKRANAWGIHDSIGNIKQWCSDDFHDEANAALARPAAGRKVVRGSYFASFAPDCRSAARAGSAADLRHVAIGFRIKLAPRPDPASSPLTTAGSGTESAAPVSPRCLVVGRGLIIRDAIDHMTRAKLMDVPLDISVLLNERLGLEGVEASLVFLAEKNLSNRIGTAAQNPENSTPDHFNQALTRLAEAAQRQQFTRLLVVQFTSLEMIANQYGAGLSQATVHLHLLDTSSRKILASWTEKAEASKWNGYLNNYGTFTERVAKTVVTKLKSEP